MLQEELRQRLLREYRNAADKMKETPIPARKMFYFSVLYSETQRVLNWQWDRELVIIYTIMQNTHAQVNAGMQAHAATQALPLDWQGLLDKLTILIEEFADCFEKQENIYDTLGKFAELSYASSGNGSYLLDKGEIIL
ncbi:hypothetical protein ACFLXY_03190 [Chloroflexota bacterium]